MKKTILFVVAAFILASAHSQIKLSQQAEEKATQVVDDLLFGKKKKKVTSAADPEMDVLPAASDENTTTTSSDPLGGYVPEPVDFDRLTSEAAVPFRDLINFLPNRAGNYVLAQKPEGSSMKYGDWNYSFAQKTLRNGDQTLSVAIYDYLSANALLAPYTQQYEYESTDGVLTSVSVQDQPGWYSANFSDDSHSLVLVVKNRFYLVFSGDGLSKEKLTGWASELNLSRLPEGKPADGE